MNYVIPIKHEDINLPHLEKAGYWFSTYSGNWYVKSSRKPFIKNCGAFGWDEVTDEDEIEALIEGRIPGEDSEYEPNCEPDDCIFVGNQVYSNS